MAAASESGLISREQVEKGACWVTKVHLEHMKSHKSMADQYGLVVYIGLIHAILQSYHMLHQTLGIVALTRNKFM